MADEQLARSNPVQKVEISQFNQLMKYLCKVSVTQKGYIHGALNNTK